MNFFNSFTSIFTEKKIGIFTKIKSLFDDDKKNLEYINSLNDILLESDVGLEATEKIIALLRSQKNLESNSAIKFSLLKILNDILEPCQSRINLDVFPKPFVLLTCGINGVGKTTTVAKIANLYKKLNKKVLVVAGDTYRAAAIEQLSTICENNMISIFKQHHGADSASVIYDALFKAKKSDIDLLVVDTSGRLHTNNLLMSDLCKIENAIKKINIMAPHEILIVMDVNFGQNLFDQLTNFKKNVNVSGICFTKFDGTAKGGTIFGLANRFNIPIRYICFGEKINDIDFFCSEKFLDKLLK